VVADRPEQSIGPGCNSESSSPAGGSQLIGLVDGGTGGIRDCGPGG